MNRFFSLGPEVTRIASSRQAAVFFICIPLRPVGKEPHAIKQTVVA
jgi:hypothetical protein